MRTVNLLPLLVLCAGCQSEVSSTEDDVTQRPVMQAKGNRLTPTYLTTRGADGSTLVQFWNFNDSALAATCTLKQVGTSQLCVPDVLIPQVVREVFSDANCAAPLVSSYEHGDKYFADYAKCGKGQELNRIYKRTAVHPDAAPIFTVWPDGSCRQTARTGAYSASTFYGIEDMSSSLVAFSSRGSTTLPGEQSGSRYQVRHESLTGSDGSLVIQQAVVSETGNRLEMHPFESNDRSRMMLTPISYDALRLSLTEAKFLYASATCSESSALLAPKECSDRSPGSVLWQKASSSTPRKFYRIKNAAAPVNATHFQTDEAPVACRGIDNSSLSGLPMSALEELNESAFGTVQDGETKALNGVDGTRLKVRTRLLQTADGLSARIGESYLFDTELGVECYSNGNVCWPGSRTDQNENFPIMLGHNSFGTGRAPEFYLDSQCLSEPAFAVQMRPQGRSTTGKVFVTASGGLARLPSNPPVTSTLFLKAQGACSAWTLSEGEVVFPGTPQVLTEGDLVATTTTLAP